MWRVFVLAGTAGAASACGGGLPEPAFGPSSGDALVDVTSPPPAAHVEFVPEPPRDDRAVWVDGQWTWDAKWRWQPGGWYAPPKGARFAPWRTFRREDGSLVLAPPSWRDARGQLIPPPPVLVPAAAAHAAQEPETTPVEERR